MGVLAAIAAAGFRLMGAPVLHVRADGWPVDYAEFPSEAAERPLREGFFRTDCAGLAALLADAAEVARRQAQSAPPPADPVPDSLSLKQLLLALALLGHIDQVEAEAAAETGALPSAFAGLLDGLVATGHMTSDEAWVARLTWKTMTTAYRGDALWNTLVAGGLATHAQIDDVFRFGATFQ